MTEMVKPFFEVFPTLEMDERIREKLDQAFVSRVTRTKRGDMLHVYLDSPVLIGKSDIWKIEKEIRGQLFADMHLGVRIREHFTLRDSYTAEALLAAYEESFLQELKTQDPVLHSLYSHAVVTFPAERTIRIAVEDGVVEHEIAPRLVDALGALLSGRFDLDAEITCDYLPRKKEERSPGEAPRYHAYPAPPSSPKTEGGAARQTGEKHRAAQSASKKGTPVSPEDIIYGKPFSDRDTAIDMIDADTGEAVAIRGEIIKVEDRSVRGGKRVISFGVHDTTDTIGVKMFVAEENAEAMLKAIHPGAFVRVKGTPLYDSFTHETGISHLVGVAKSKRTVAKRKDEASEKRAELHCHTRMSDMDGVSDVKEIIKRAYKWGMPGIAITDHGVVQALTEGAHTWSELYKAACLKAAEEKTTEPDRQDFFKLVPGMECYLVDDTKLPVENAKGQRLSESCFVVFDLETTGFSPRKNRIIEIGGVKIEGGKITGRFSEFVNPGEPISARITQLTHITDAMVRDAEGIEEVLPRFAEFAKGAVLVGHNVSFDMSFLKENLKRLGIDADYTSVDTMGLSRYFFPQQARHRLDTVARTLHVELKQHHRAIDDTEATAQIFLHFLKMLEQEGIHTTDEIAQRCPMGEEAVRHLYPHHAVLLAKNTLGRVHLYTLVSESHLHHYRHMKPESPLIPVSLLQRYREGLLVGSADAHGALWEAVMEDRDEEEIERIASLYDYLEVQPEENYAYMVESPRYEYIRDMADVREINRRIIALGERLGKIVCATSDAHFLHPEDMFFRTILVEGKDIKGGRDGIKIEESKNVKKDDAAAPLYLRTTDEMLAAFSWLGEEKAKEIVVDNTRDILDRCDAVTMVRPDKCPPVIADSDKTLRALCYEKAHEIYGDPLPDIVSERLERELTSIIGNGFAVMYIIAQKLVWKSLEDGYIVGSRGSVGSSFVAFAAGITEVNALPPHYVCPACKYSDFISDEVTAYAGMSGCDMPDRDCPVCGHRLYKDGFDIPFETFLGFHGEKEPDIDLNFSGEYQATAHRYTEEIFGKGQTYRAGTISALKDKTAYGVVKKYLEYHHLAKRKVEVDRLVAGLSGVRHGTGQHPGGIIVLPIGEDINTFTPVQHPANKADMDTVTTHYDYHSIDHNLLKLDILGHDDPTMVRFLHDATGIDPTKVPLDDERVMQLFIDTSSLGITPAQIGGTKLGCLGLPEFGTDFAMQMVLDAKPTSFSHLIRIAGLAHGTDVWIGNARDLILSGTATIDTAICNRDDIMNYLIHKGVDPQLAFNTMERVRKGNGLTDEMKTAMLNAQVPDWYIDSCIKIKYMFPKAHATAYVMNAWRIAWFKVHEPLAFYAAWFSIRAKALSYDMMCRGAAHLEEVMADYALREKELSNVEQLAYGDMRVVQEMYARGFEFMPVDIFRAKAEHFRVIDGKIMPSLVAIDGMGPVAAQAICEEAKKGRFLSHDDFKERTKCPQAVMDKMIEMGLLGDIPASNQISLFDLI